ncbi:hypothetical protein PV646_43910 [Streptomyces sp. ID05-26A]|nr:hypothetical protein [Streptomyces sp. ID05-26A]
MATPLRITLAVAVLALAAGAFLLAGKPTSTQVTSTTVPSGSPGAGWTEEEMRNARGADMTAGPGVETLVIGGVVLAAAILLLVRRRDSPR